MTCEKAVPPDPRHPSRRPVSVCGRCEREPAAYRITFWQVARQQQALPVIIGSTEPEEVFGIAAKLRTWEWVPSTRWEVGGGGGFTTFQQHHHPTLPSLSYGSVEVNSPSRAPRLARGQGGNRQAVRQPGILSECVRVGLAAAHSVLFDSAGLIRHPAPWQQRGLNSSVKSLSTQTHAHSPWRRERSRERGGYLSELLRRQCLAFTKTSDWVFPLLVCLIYSWPGQQRDRRNRKGGKEKQQQAEY